MDASVGQVAFMSWPILAAALGLTLIGGFAVFGGRAVHERVVQYVHKNRSQYITCLRVL